MTDTLFQQPARLEGAPTQRFVQEFRYVKIGSGVLEMPIKTQATIEDLYHVPESGKAEIVNGELRLMAPTGNLPGSAADEVFVCLRAHARRTGVGRAYGDNKGFIVR